MDTLVINNTELAVVGDNVVVSSITNRSFLFDLDLEKQIGAYAAPQSQSLQTVYDQGLASKIKLSQSGRLICVVAYRPQNIGFFQPLLICLSDSTRLTPSHRLDLNKYLNRDQKVSIERSGVSRHRLRCQGTAMTNSNILSMLLFLVFVLCNTPCYAQKRALSLVEKSDAPSDPAKGECLISLASLYIQQGNYPEAEAVLKRGLPMLEKALGPSEFPSCLISLATTYRKKGKYEDAELLLKRALAMLDQSHDPIHANTAARLQKYASLRDTKQEAEAAELEARAKAILAGQK